MEIACANALGTHAQWQEEAAVPPTLSLLVPWVEHSPGVEESQVQYPLLPEQEKGFEQPLRSALTTAL